MKKLLICAALMLLGYGAASAQSFSISTNAVDLAGLGTLNCEAAYGVARHWTVNASVKYNPFSYGQGEQIVRYRQRALSAGARYWPWHVFSGWWLSGNVRYQEYNHGGLLDEKSVEGDRFGTGVAGGYTYMLSPHLNLDFGLGVWAGYDIYKRYSCPTCGRIEGSGGKFFVLPSEIIVALTFIF
ncbi:MAG: DUF3575 domain-containing protein [Bacteroidales bacterium]|nr:DUF3575 domain-containing protein [Bacteroidales bacterium]